MDVCQAFNRRYAAFDINPLEDKGIRKADVTEGVPVEAGKADAVFFDPPYWRLKDDDYIEGSISASSPAEWLEFIDGLFGEFERVGKSDLTIGFICQPMYDDKDTEQFWDLPFEANRLASSHGWTQEQRISVPMTHGMKSNHAVQHAKENGYLLDLNRDFLVWGVQD